MIKKLRVTVDGKPYDVTVEVPEESETGGTSAPAPAPVATPTPHAPPPPAPVQPAAPAAPTAKPSSGPGDVPSPLAGRVITVVVKPGQEVNENEHLLTLEAMKMNTFVFAPKAGKVLEIPVVVGDAVTEGQLLVRIG